MNHQDYFDYLMRIDELKINNKRNLFLPDIASPCMYNSVGTYAITPDGEIFKCIEHVGNKNKSIGNIIKESISLERLSSCFSRPIILKILNVLTVPSYLFVGEAVLLIEKLTKV